MISTWSPDRCERPQAAQALVATLPQCSRIRPLRTDLPWNASDTSPVWIDLDGRVKPPTALPASLARRTAFGVRARRSFPPRSHSGYRILQSCFLPPRRRSRKSANSCKASLWSMALAVKLSDAAECRHSQERPCPLVESRPRQSRPPELQRRRDQAAPLARARTGVALLRQTQRRNAGAGTFDRGPFVRRFPRPLCFGGRRL
jgi:hypothetical protein